MKWFSRPSTTGEPSLLAQIEALSGDEREGVARGLALIWDDFVKRFEGIDGFNEATSVARLTFIQKMRDMDRSLQVNPAQQPLALAPRAMLEYLDALSQSVSENDLHLQQALADLIDLGRKLRRVGRAGPMI